MSSPFYTFPIDEPEKELTPLEYKLPEAVKDAKESWTSRMQAIAVVTALFASVEATLLGYITSTNGQIRSPKVEKAVYYFGYTSIFLNMGATLASILLLIAAASLPGAARKIYSSCGHGYPRKVFTNQQEYVSGLNRRLREGDGESYLLRGFGIAQGWDMLLRHCVLCFMGGWICSFVHIGLYIWLTLDNLVAALIMPSAALAALPPLIIFMFCMDTPACRECNR